MIETQRLLLRPLTVGDVSERYLFWFQGAGADRITATKTTHSLDDLRTYVAEREARDDVLFLGLFERDSGMHVGNLKYEPISRDDGTAILGIFIGDAAARGKGYAGEAIMAANAWLQANRGVRQVVLGVEADNLPAVRAYEGLGFERRATSLIPDAPNVFGMVLDL